MSGGCLQSSEGVDIAPDDVRDGNNSRPLKDGARQIRTRHEVFSQAVPPAT